MAFATGRNISHAAIRVPFQVEDVVEMVRAVFEERVHNSHGVLGRRAISKMIHEVALPGPHGKQTQSIPIGYVPSMSFRIPSRACSKRWRCRPLKGNSAP